MDNITHTLFGATLARTPLGRAGRGATAALILASNAPDIDVVTTMGGAASYLEWHRGPTHGPLGICSLGLIAAGLVCGGYRVFGRNTPDGQEPPSFARLAIISIVAVLFHVLMDLPTSYGTRLLSPFGWHWYAADLMPIIDIYLLAILAAGLFFGRHAPRRNAAIALVLMALNYGIRVASHHQAMTIAPRVFGPTLPERCASAAPEGLVIDRWPAQSGIEGSPPTIAEGGTKRCLVELAAMPSFTSPFEWRLVARMSNAYEMRDVNLVDARLRRPPLETEAMWRLSRHYPNMWTPVTQAAAGTRVAQIFLGFSRFPQARTTSDQQNVTTVRFEDMRFTAPRSLGPGASWRRESDELPNLFTVIVRVGPAGEILEQKLGP